MSIQNVLIINDDNYVVERTVLALNELSEEKFSLKEIGGNEGLKIFYLLNDSKEEFNEKQMLNDVSKKLIELFKIRTLNDLKNTLNYNIKESYEQFLDEDFYKKFMPEDFYNNKLKPRGI